MKLTIDTADIRNRWGRWWWKLLRRTAKAGQCHGCGTVMTADERHYYVSHCERCERSIWAGLDE